MGQLFANGARAALSAGIAAGDTTLTITSGGALFPIANTDAGAVGGSLDWYKAVLDDGTNFEIVYIRTHTSASTSFTNVMRGQEGTTALSFAAGAVLGVRVTAEDMRLSIGREKLATARAYYVGSAPAAVSFTAASANVTWAAHGLSVNAAVVLSILPNTGTFTVTLASPGVFTKTAHGYTAGRPVKFSTTGALPTGLAAGTTYYVIATGLTADAFQVSATVGGAAVNTSGSQSGTHYAEATGAMPTFSTAGLLVAGTVYYVKTVVDANTVTLSTTAGGTALGTCTVATGAPVYSARTGSDSNTGLSNTVGSAFLTTQKAVDTACNSLDLGGQALTINVADGAYPTPVVMRAFVGDGSFSIVGNVTTPANVLISTTSSSAVTNSDTGRTLSVTGVKLQTTTSGSGLSATGGGSKISFGNVDFGACAANHVSAANGGQIACTANYTISGGAQIHAGFVESGIVSISGRTIALTGTPNFSVAYAYARTSGSFLANACTFNGSATGVRFNLSLNSTCFVNLAADTYLPGNAVGSKTTGGEYL